MPTLLDGAQARHIDKGLLQRTEFSKLTLALDPENSTSRAEILPTHTPALFKTAVARAAELLRAGEVVALPTETVYGLAANALDALAVTRIFEIKGRPPQNPIITHVVGLEMARQCVRYWPAAADHLAKAFWPGPLTLVLPRSNEIPDIVTAGGPTVGVRWPGHPFIQAVIAECGFPLAAPSANLSNRLSPTNASHVNKDLGEKIRLIVDGGQSQVGIESTVLDLTTDPPQVLRPGMINATSLRAVLEREETRTPAGGSTGRPGTQPRLRSPGMLPRHYSPKAKVEIWRWKNTEDLESQISKRPWQISKVHIIAHTVVPAGGSFGAVSVIPHDAEAFARAIYAQLHQCDEAGAKWIVVEALPSTDEWTAIADRLRRAAA